MTKLLDWISRRLAIWFIASALLAGGSMWFIAAIYRAPAAEEQPKVTDWMQAWGSILGVVAGLAAAGAAAALFLHERRRSEQAERQLIEEREEAALNAPRAVVATPARFGTFGGDSDAHISEVVLTVHNYGSNPIRNLAVIVTLPKDGRHLILPHHEGLGPGDKHDFRQRYQAGLRVPGPWSPIMGRAPVTVCFIDHTNQAWQRTSDGGVERTSVPYPFLEEALSTLGSLAEWD
ncbi:hypothetical protein O7614_30600 [Micromonospora sp. WMMD961]|uniref:hypothetical protein n=1 Tax=Micromonospora sp. WMMD961 TaxID=3016100 RepID=UPI0024161D0F|nr:hypothetical protein [Micromonospora sp. WMMD961]MDG4784010.1 hypothetical protein [Micromonospora sp. WMMD961]